MSLVLRNSNTFYPEIIFGLLKITFSILHIWKKINRNLNLNSEEFCDVATKKGHNPQLM